MADHGSPIDMKRGSGTHGLPKRGASQPTPRRDKATAGGTQPQLARLTNIEQQLQHILQGSGTSRSDHVGGSGKAHGGIEGKIANIERMMDELKAKAEKPKEGNKTVENHTKAVTIDEDESGRESAASIARRLLDERKQAKKKEYRTVNLAEIPDKTYNKFYMMKLTEESRRCVNPYSLIERIEKDTGAAPKRVFGNNRLSLTVEVSSEKQGEYVREIKEVEGFPCEVVVHPRYNHNRALIYVHEFDIENMNDFKNELQTRYNIVDVQPATFIKTRSPQTHVFIVTFMQEHLPYSIYIPGERQDTKVIKFKNKPLMCAKCLQYGHASKFCKRQESTCKKCSVLGHSVEQCSGEEEKCVHCGETHSAGSPICQKYLKEEALIRIQEEEKVTLMRARQMMENNNEYVDRPKQQFTTHYDCKMDEKDKRKFTPWLLEKCLTQQLGSKPTTIRTTNNTTFTVEVASREQSMHMQRIKDINGISTEISVNKSFNTIKGLVYVYGYNLSDFEAFKRGMIKQYGLQDVIEASWIKPRGNSNAKPLLLSFPKELPNYVDIPGEMMRTKVYEYKQRPMMCRICLEYGHGRRFCEKEQKCGRCGEEGHDKANCRSDTVQCYHCKESHEVGHRDCIEERYQQEIVAVQTKQRVSRFQAKAVVDRDKPNFKTRNYACAVKATPGTSVQLERNRVVSQTTPNAAGQAKGNEPSGAEEVEVVCMSPSSGTMFTTTVNLAKGEGRRVNLEDRTSENSAIVRAEVRRVFDEQMTEGKQGDETMEENEDKEQYEDDLERARKTEKRVQEKSDKQGCKVEKQQRQDGERKRHRSGTRRSRSNSNDRRRQHSKQRRL